jgi:hypothetical protein
MGKAARRAAPARESEPRSESEDRMDEETEWRRRLVTGMERVKAVRLTAP